ncbi:MAG: ATP-dependent helicase [Lachnospiraceae bacterium]|nr:ATP-dependent helicase [Lachnospiraceae bacterium]
MLDEFQKRSVNHYTGPCLTIAGPGSGKTKCLVERVIHLIKHHQVPPEKILVITFTRAAAKEMEERFRKEFKHIRKMPYFGTFHSFFFHILITEGLCRPSDVISDEGQLLLLKKVLDHLHITVSLSDQWDVLKEFSYCRNLLIPPKKFRSEILSKEFASAFHLYEQMKSTLGYLDYDDMMVRTRDLLTINRDVKERWKNKYSFILLDEVQDINALQYSVVKLLLNEEQNLYAVGDDDQSIYGFRGSDPKIMLSFQKEFKNAEMITLGYNYRSVKNIVKVSDKLIKNNRHRYDKDIQAFHDHEGDIRYHMFADATDEAVFVLQRIKKHLSNPKHPTLGILYRRNKDCDKIKELLEREHVEFEDLYTFHGAKGLEFDDVICIHVNERMVPSLGKGSDLEEERRMFYVAVTRAKHNLYVCCLKKKDGKLCHPSRFINEMQA